MKFSKQVHGILWMLLHCFSVSLTSLFIRILSNHDISTFMILFLQNLFAFVLINIWAKTEGITDLYKTQRIGGHFIRSIVGVGASAIFYYCLTILPITEVTAIGFSEPLFSALLAVLILHERIYMHRTAALVVGFIGTMIILRPGTDFHTSALLVLLSAFLFGMVNICIKKLGHTERSRTLLVYRYLFYSLLSIIPALYSWKTPTLMELSMVGLLALSLSMSATSLVKALQYCDITVLSPFRFSKLIFVGVFAYLLFGEVMDTYTIIGSIVVIASVVYIGYRESRVHNKPKKALTGLSKGAIKCLAPLALLALSACGDTWMGEKEIPLEGERISVITQEHSLSVDNTLQGINVELPASAVRNSSVAKVDNIAFNGTLAGIQKAEIGKGYAPRGGVAPAPIVVNDTVYAVDGRGYVSAHEVTNIRNTRWIKNTTPEEYEDKAMIGGLGYAENVLFITTGYGDVIALSTKDGTELWRTETSIPLRSAPALHDGKVFVVNINNEVIALDAGKGEIAWKYKGMKEITGVLGFATPVVYKNSVLVSLSSGELVSLQLGTGKREWGQFITAKQYGAPKSSFSDIDAAPIVHNDTIFVAANNGVLKALNKDSVDKSWTQNIRVTGDIAAGGDFLFMVTQEKELLCLYQKTGGIKWKTELPQYENVEDKKGAIRYTSPVIVNNALWLFGSDGLLREYSAHDGTLKTQHRLSETLSTQPVVLNKGIYGINEAGNLLKIH